MDVMQRIIEAISKQEHREPGIHVSSLCSNCLRKSYYELVQPGDGKGLDFKTIMAFWIGHKIHETQILKEAEIPLNWFGILGSCDEYEDGILLEKKTCTNIPMEPRPTHILQAEYYSVMLSKINRPVNEAYIVYIDISNKIIKVHQAQLRPLPIIEAEMVEKKQKLDKAIELKQPPERDKNWLCNYCSYVDICNNEGDNAERVL